MKSDQPEASLGSLVEIQRGNTYKSRKLDEEGPVLLGLSAIGRNGGFRRDKLRTYGGDSPEQLLVHSGELFLSLKDVTQSGDLLGSVARLPDDIEVGRLTQDTVRLDLTDPEVSPEYLYWILRTPQYRRYCRAHATGTTNLGLDRGDFLAFHVPAPSKPRTQIVTLLELLEAKIETNQQLARTLEELAATQFRTRLVNFVGQEDLVDSEIGPIPRGWTVSSLGDLVETLREKSTQADRPYLGLSEMPKGSTVLSDWVEPNEAPSGSSWNFSRGDILFGRLRPYFKKVGVAPVDGCGSTELIVMRAKELEYWGVALMTVSSDPFIEFCDMRSTGTRMPRIGWDDVARFPIGVPPGDELAKFNEIVAVLYDRILASIHESKNLAEIRDTLLLNLISGEIRASVAEDNVEAV